MITQSVDDIARMAGGVLLRGEGTVNAVSTDTRAVSEGALFVALLGERFDAHAFLDQAVEAGAAALLISDESKVPVAYSGAVIQVVDTLVGLQRLAAAYRRQLRLKVVTITGSNGKTSTKDMVAAVLRSRFQVTATQGNLNNHIGLPLSVLSAEAADDYAVWEIGMNHPGEIAPLAAIAAPDYALITNIGTAHIGNMGSREAIALEKGMLAEALTEKGTLIVNAEDSFASTIQKRTKGHSVTVGFSQGDVRGSDVETSASGMVFTLHAGGQRARVTLPVLGRHMVANALLAAALGWEAGLTIDDIAHALTNVVLTPGRLQPVKIGNLQFINDAYNANPDSMRASLRTVAELPVSGRRIALLGRMGELGPENDEAHRAIGRLALTEGMDVVCSVGEGAELYTKDLGSTNAAHIVHVQNHRAAVEFLKENVMVGDLVLLKGSRTAAMDTILKLYNEA